MKGKHKRLKKSEEIRDKQTETTDRVPIKWISVGATCVVYEIPGGNGERLCMKILISEIQAEREKLMNSELGVLQRFKANDCIPRLLDFDLPQACFLMEMLEEITSAKFVEYDWVQFAKNIRKIHGQGFVHRDIRCQNIMARGNTLVLIDWGYSCKANTQHLCNGTAITAPQRILKSLLRSEIVSWDVWDDIESLVKVFLIYFLSQELKIYELGNSMDRIKEYASYWEYWEQNERNAKTGFALCNAKDFDGLLDWMAKLLQIKRKIAAGTYHK